MKVSGRLLLISLFTLLHSYYVLSNFFTYNNVEWIDVFGYPLVIVIGYWIGYQYDKVKYSAEIDTLTNLYNRKSILQSFNKIKNTVRRKNKKYYILVIDCDNFKNINDTYGHSMGDTVLREIGLVLTKRTRSTDIVSRWGGDEFVLFGQYDGEKGLNGLTHRIKGELKVLSKELDVPISVSIGSAICPDDHHLLDELVSIADKNMYVAKQTSRRISLEAV